MPGSLILLGGEPGIGKSTLLLQISLKLPYKTLYVSGEESQKQIKMRAERITPNGDNCYILTETKTQNIFRQIQEIEPEIVIIDSIQTLHTDYIESTAGSISQIRECTAELIKFAKETNVPVILIGHITKDGTIAGPKILEHMVDTVLQFEGDRNHVYRILRSLKNRFGSTAELGIYEMQGSGLREVSNPSEILLSHREEELSGTAIASTLEGMRPLMIEIQALVSTAVYGTPQRSTTGYNAKRLNMLLAVLEKRAGFRLGTKAVSYTHLDVYKRQAQNRDNERDSDCTFDDSTGLPEGKGESFFEFIGGELLPFLQNKYRISPFKIIAGHDVTAGYMLSLIHI